MAIVVSLWLQNRDIGKHKAAFLPVAQQCCLTGKAALWHNLWSLAFLAKQEGWA